MKRSAPGRPFHCARQWSGISLIIKKAGRVIFLSSLAIRCVYSTYYGKPAQEPTCEEVRCFEVTDEPKKAEQKIFSAPIVPLREIPKQTVLPAIPDGPYFQQLTTIDTPPIKIAKEALPKPKRTISEQDKPAQNSEALTNFEPANQSKKEHNRLLRWIHRLRKRNKEDPLAPPRE